MALIAVLVVVAVAAVGVAVWAVAFRDSAPASNSTTTAAVDPAQQMITDARNVILAQTLEAGRPVKKFGEAKLRNALQVVMPVDVYRDDGSTLTMWFQVNFVEAGGVVKPFGKADVGLKESDLYR